MSTRVRFLALAATLACSIAGLGAQQPSLDRSNLPEGFSIEVYAEGLTNPRSMVLSPNGTLFVGSRMTPQDIARGAPRRTRVRSMRCSVVTVTSVPMRVVDYEVFADGWLGPDNIGWGRPVDVLVMPDGALLVSDDRMGVIYRINYAD